MNTQNKDVVTIVDGVKFTQCAYRGPKGFKPAAVKKPVQTRITDAKAVK